MKFVFLIFLLVVLIILVNVENSKTSVVDNRTIDVVVARYKEDVSWVPRNDKLNIIVYNKGPDDIKNAIPLQNVGRDAHTYLWHIVNNYHRLADVTIFIPGSGNIIHKRGRIDRLFGYILNDKLDNCVIGSKEELEYNFYLDMYHSTSSENYNGSELTPCYIRPYGKWHEMVIGNRWADFISYNLISAFSKETIRQYPIEFYQKLLSFVNKVENSECIHYIERSWASIFWPYPEYSKKEYTLLESIIKHGNGAV